MTVIVPFLSLMTVIETVIEVSSVEKGPHGLTHLLRRRLIRFIIGVNRFE